MTNEPDLVHGVAWYKREQWSRLRELAADPDVLEEKYEEWLTIAKEAVLDLSEQGIRAERVEIDVDELIDWCREHKRPLDGNARAAFTSLKLRERHVKKG